MEIDDAIGQVSQLYRTVTGQEIPASETPYAPIPPERDPVQHVQEQMDRLIGLLNAPGQSPNGSANERANGQAPESAHERAQERAQERAWVPPVTIYESPTEIVFAVEAPGASRDRVDVHLEGGMLIVAGRRTPSPADGQTMRHTEVRFGTFRRVVPLPPGLRTTDMTARLEGGVLEVRIPRDGAGGVRRIDVS